MIVKTTLLVILSLSSALSLHSQQISIEGEGADIMTYPSKIEVADTSYMECVYLHIIHDPVLDKTNTQHEILEIGRLKSYYADYGAYRQDSVIRADYPDGIRFNDRLQLCYRMNYKSGGKILKDIANNKLANDEQLFMDRYRYEEELPHFDWNLTEDTDMVCGYKCQKAVASFRGRDWNVWYTEEIPVDNGPWKFNGLPGLILKAEDSKQEHRLEAIQVRKSSKPFGFTTGSFIIPIDRKSFNKMKKDYKTDAGSFVNGSPLAPTKTDGTPAIDHRRRFFNPMESD